VKLIYLKKACDDGISLCSCGDGRVAFPAQMDCPWCGCGWLFTCINCGKAFTFAEGVEIESSWEALARTTESEEDEIASWIEAMKIITAGVKVGERYVIIDGFVLPADARHVAFDGWHAHHEFEIIPQVQALEDRSILDAKLGNRRYWTENALPEDPSAS
jgi:hypothetical protein